MWYRKTISITLTRVPPLTMICLLVGCLLAPMVHADEKLSNLRVLFRNGHFSEILGRLRIYRDQPYGKTAEVDYMMATCLCRTADVRKGKTRFEWILSRYRLDDTRRKAVEEGMRQCGSTSQPTPVLFQETTVTSRSSAREVGFSGKSAWTPGRGVEEISRITGTKVAVTSETAVLIRDIPMEEFGGRLFELTQKAAAVQSVKRLVGENFRTKSIGPFIIASSKNRTPHELRAIGQNLDRFASFYVSQYKMRRPSKFITIYLVQSRYDLQELARKLHGIRVSEFSIGYSFPYDLSMVGVIYGTEVGTLAHELFHLMVRNDFGDIPPWLEEGMACLYTVSEARNDLIAGLPNWRGRILKTYWRDRPSVEDLVTMDWRAFDSAGDRQDFRQQAINHATANYFMLYLQESGKLLEVYDAFRHRNVDDLELDPRTDTVRLLGRVLQKSLKQVDGDFKNWFEESQQANAAIDPENIPSEAEASDRQVVP